MAVKDEYRGQFADVPLAIEPSDVMYEGTSPEQQLAAWRERLERVNQALKRQRDEAELAMSARQKFVFIVHPDCLEEFSRAIDADELLRDRVQLVKSELGSVDDRINFIDDYQQLGEGLGNFYDRMQREQHLAMQRGATHKGKRIAQWKLEKRGGRR